VHDVLRKFVAYCKRKCKKKLNQFLVMIWNCFHLNNQKIEFTKIKAHFQKSYLLKNYVIFFSCTWTIISIYYNNLQKNSKIVQKFNCMENLF
jgi:hypothetical protein